MADLFNEPKAICESIAREFTSVGSLNTATAFSAVVACEGTVSALVKETTGADFPYKNYPRHKPGQWITSLGIFSYYSSETKKFLNKIDGYSLDKARYENQPAFRQYTSATAHDRSHVLVEGEPRLISETERLIKIPEVVSQLQSVSKTWK
jgi:hypothetical protein